MNKSELGLAKIMLAFMEMDTPNFEDTEVHAEAIELLKELIEEVELENAE